MIKMWSRIVLMSVHDQSGVTTGQSNVSGVTTISVRVEQGLIGGAFDGSLKLKVFFLSAVGVIMFQSPTAMF